MLKSSRNKQKINHRGRKVHRERFKIKLGVLCELSGNMKGAMAGKIIIDTERCKGCGLCVVVCPKNSIVISQKSNKNGYFPARTTDADCTGCAACAIICPEAIIKVFREEDVVAIEPDKKKKPNLIKEKA